VGFDRDDVFVLICEGLFISGSIHESDGRAVEIAVAEADFESLLGEGSGEVGGDS